MTASPLPQPPGLAALIAPGTHWDARAFAERCAARLRELRRQGLRAGQLVLCPALAENGELPLLHQALAEAGAALLPVAPDCAPAAREALLATTGAEWCWRPGPVGGALLATGQALPASPWPDPLAAVVQTSGSLGVPKLAMLSRGALRHAAAATAARLDLRAGDLWLCCLPGQHIGGLTILDRCAEAGAALLLHRGFAVADVASALRQYPVTHVSLVPAMLARLLETRVSPPASLRVALIGGQALDSGLARAGLAAGWPLFLSYGMTETAAMIAGRPLLPADSEDAAPGQCVGTPLVGIEADCPSCDAAPGVLRLRGASIMAGYANPERRPGQGLAADGWLTTADLACRMPGGAWRLFGRADDRLTIAGVNVLPAEIEARLRAAPGVADCAVLGLPEPVWGYRLIALYRGNTDAPALAAWCRAHLPSAQRPRGFLRLEQWPLLAAGKPDRRRLCELAEAARVQTVTIKHSTT